MFHVKLRRRAERLSFGPGRPLLRLAAGGARKNFLPEILFRFRDAQSSLSFATIR